MQYWTYVYNVLCDTENNDTKSPPPLQHNCITSAAQFRQKLADSDQPDVCIVT